MNKIISYHNNGKIKICIASITSAELTKSRLPADNYEIFTKRLRTLGIIDPKILVSVPNFGMGYWGAQSQYSDTEAHSLIKKIHEIMWPDTPYSHDEYRELSSGRTYINGIAKKWRSKQMDVLTIFSHMRNSCDIFVSTDKVFLGEEKKRKLEQLGARQIMPPSEVEQWLHQNLP